MSAFLTDESISPLVLESGLEERGLDALFLAEHTHIPVGSPGQLGEAFLPTPAMNVGFTAEMNADAARSYAACILTPGSTFPLIVFIVDILATDGAARAGLMASISASPVRR